MPASTVPAQEEAAHSEREFFVDNQLVRIRSVTEVVLTHSSCKDAELRREREILTRNPWIVSPTAFSCGRRSKPNISPRFEKLRFWSTDSSNRGFFSACSDARPQNLQPPVHTNFQFCWPNVVSNFLSARRKIAQNFLHVILRNRQFALTPTPGRGEITSSFIFLLIARSIRPSSPIFLHTLLHT